MITTVITSSNEKAFQICNNMAFSMPVEKIVASLQSGKAKTQLIVLNTVDRLLCEAQGGVFDFTCEIMKTQDSKIARFGDTAYGLSEKQAQQVAREIIERRSIAEAMK